MSAAATRHGRDGFGGRLEELLAGDVLDDLTASEQDELLRLEAEREHDWERDEFNHAAVAVVLGNMKGSDFVPIPADVSRLLEAAAAGWSAAAKPVAAARAGGASETRRVTHDETGAGRAERAPGRRIARGRQVLWFAAIGVLAVVSLSVFLGRGAADVAGQRLTLVATASDVVQWDWAAWDNPAMEGVSGDVVWSDSQQRGFMRLRGLAVNNPSIEQYQLWIVDSKRGLESRFSGGVFDVSASGEVIVPIESDLVVERPQLFAVTVEKPGGTGISDMARRAVLAKRPG